MPARGKLGGMDVAATRFFFGLLVLLACAIVSWIGDDKTPSRTVVELVSVVYKPARAVPGPAVEAATVEPAHVEPGPAVAAVAAEPAAPVAQAATAPAPPQRMVPPQVPAAVHASAAPQHKPAAARSARTRAAHPAGVKAVSCRPPACRAAAPGKGAMAARSGTRQGRQARPAEPPLPAVFVPIRRLGLALQARLGVSQDGKVAPRKRRR